MFLMPISLMVMVACLANWLARWLSGGWALIQGGIGFVAPTRHCLRFFTHMRGGGLEDSYVEKNL